MGLKTLNIKRYSVWSSPQFITKISLHLTSIPIASSSDAGDVPLSPVKAEKAHEETTKENVHAKIAEGRAELASKESNGFMDVVSKIGTGVGRVISIIYQAARDTVNDVIRNIIPFMAFVSVLIGIINYTGFANVLAGVLTPLAGSLPGMLAIGMFCSIPFLSPLICPGAIIASVLSVLVGNQIANGTIPANFALPGFFAVNCQVGSDFAPVGMTLMEAKPRRSKSVTLHSCLAS